MDGSYHDQDEVVLLLLIVNTENMIQHVRSYSYYDIQGCHCVEPETLATLSEKLIKEVKRLKDERDTAFETLIEQQNIAKKASRDIRYLKNEYIRGAANMKNRIVRGINTHEFPLWCLSQTINAIDPVSVKDEKPNPPAQVQGLRPMYRMCPFTRAPLFWEKGRRPYSWCENTVRWVKSLFKSSR